jgi:hypothetical protein
MIKAGIKERRKMKIRIPLLIIALLIALMLCLAAFTPFSSLLIAAPGIIMGGHFNVQQASSIISNHSYTAEMFISGNGKEITHLCNTPSTTDNTDFGNVNIGGSPMSRTFIISNTGLSELTLNGQPSVTISGSQAEDFRVTTYPSASIANGSGTSLEITFSPGEAGSSTALVSITSNDPQKSIYRFFVNGKGTRELKAKAFVAPEESDKSLKSSPSVMSPPPVTFIMALKNDIPAEGKATISADSNVFHINLQSNFDANINSKNIH